jgi:hypothetical protein
MSKDSEQQARYFMMKGVVSSLPKEDQEKIAAMKSRFKLIIEEDKDISIIALSMAMHESEVGIQEQLPEKEF